MALPRLRLRSRPLAPSPSLVSLPTPSPISWVVPSALLALWLAMAMAACTSTRPCKSGTLLVSIDLDATSAMANKLEVAVRIAGGAPTISTLDHTSGQTSGTVEIDFPGGYPQGQMVRVTVVASQGLSSLGTGTTEKQVSNGCEAFSVSVTAGSGGTGGTTGAGGTTTGTGGQGGGAGGGGGAATGGRDGGAGGADGGVGGSGGGVGGSAGGAGRIDAGTGGIVGGAGGADAGTGGKDAGADAGCVPPAQIACGVCTNTAVDRAHCGSTCATCASTEVCETSCMTATAPSFTRQPPDPAGWLDPTGAALLISVRGTGYANAIYECRTGPDASFTATTPPWGPCDGATGSGLNHMPQPDTTTPEGNYRTEHRYRADTYVSPVITLRYYVHHALDKVPICPRSGITTDGPHFTDPDYFAAAQAYATANPTLFPLTATFPAPSAIPVRSDAIYLRNPFIKIPFVGVGETAGQYGSIPVGTPTAWPTAGGNYVFNERSLRHEWALNAGRTMVLMRRRYASPAPVGNPDITCQQVFFDGQNFVGGDYVYHRMPCEALVLNTQGKGICLNAYPMSTVPLPAPVEAPVPAAGTVAATLNSTVVTGTGTGFATTIAGKFIQIPAMGGRYYKIATVTTATSITLTTVFAGPSVSGVMYRVASANTIVIPAAFAKMHPDSHSYATGAKAPGTPSPKTKCETVGCNAGRPWITYLPP